MLRRSDLRHKKTFSAQSRQDSVNPLKPRGWRRQGGALRAICAGAARVNPPTAR